MPDIRLKVRVEMGHTAVIEAVRRASAAALYQAGGYIRTVAHRSIRPAKGPSRPGRPPHSHRGQLRDLIAFEVDELRSTVVVGPKPLRGRAVVPPTLEFGGYVARQNPRRKARLIGGSGEIRLSGKACATTKDAEDLRGRWWSVTYAKIYSSAQTRRANNINEKLYGPSMIAGAVQPRPYMSPALEKSLPKITRFFENSLGRGR